MVFRGINSEQPVTVSYKLEIRTVTEKIKADDEDGITVLGKDTSSTPK